MPSPQRIALRPLLAVAFSITACGSSAVPSAIASDPIGASAPKPTSAAAEATSASALGATAPRTLPNGRPACGNVASKAPQPEGCEKP